jgi:hypothetical protein
MVCGFRDAANKKIRLAVPQDKGWEFIYTQGKRWGYLEASAAQGLPPLRADCYFVIARFLR